MSNDTNPFDAAVNVESLDSLPVHLYIQSALSRYAALAQNVQFKHHLSQSIDQMVLQITTWCASGRIPTRTESETVCWADGVWQTIKQTYAPRWFLDRFPVRLKARVIEKNTYHYFVCPHLDVPTHGRDRMTHIKFMATGSPLAERIHTNAHL